MVTEHDKLVCLDIETIPDRTLIPDWPEGKFPPKPIWHRVAAISFVEAKIERDSGVGENYFVTCCRSGGKADFNEAQLLAKFWQEYFAAARAAIGYVERKRFRPSGAACPRDDVRHLGS